MARSAHLARPTDAPPAAHAPARAEPPIAAPSIAAGETPLNQLAGISVPEAHQIVIQPWDRSVLGAIEKAIQKSDIGLVPNVDGTVVRLNIPPLTEERRKDLVRVVHKRMEEARVEIRNLRREAADALKKEEKDGTVGADESRRSLDSVQKLTDRYIADVDRRGLAKEQEVLEV